MTPHDLPPIAVGAREAQVFAELQTQELDALIVTSPSNIRWLTGFAGSAGTVLVFDNAISLFTDSRYEDRAPTELQHVESSAEVVIARETLGSELRQRVQRAELVGIEADHVSWAKHTQIDQEWLPAQTLVASAGIIDGLRASKDAAEIARIESAAGIVDHALAEVVQLLTTGLTERDFARALDAQIRAGGAEDLGFDTIVASGPNSAIPHHSPGDRTIVSGDFVIVDVGAKVDGYRSDMTRTFAMGALSTDQELQYATVIAAQEAGVEAMRAGAGTAEVDAAARAVISSVGWGDAFTHGTGHGVGLDIHELPRVARGVDDIYQRGSVATVEPGVYLRGVGGVRIEDTCVVTDSGARRLTAFPKDPVVS